jgi:hypothetical protein
MTYGSVDGTIQPDSNVSGNTQSEQMLALPHVQLHITSLGLYRPVIWRYHLWDGQ